MGWGGRFTSAAGIAWHGMCVPTSNPSRNASLAPRDTSLPQETCASTTYVRVRLVRWLTRQFSTAGRLVTGGRLGLCGVSPDSRAQSRHYMIWTARSELQRLEARNPPVMQHLVVRWGLSKRATAKHAYYKQASMLNETVAVARPVLRPS